MKKAVVLAGGGARGAYEIGAWKALNELEYKYDILTGTSVGALNGALMLQNDFDFAYDLWTNISNEKVYNMKYIDPDNQINLDKYISTIKNLAFEIVQNRGLDCTPLQQIVTDKLDEKYIRDSEIDFGVVTVEYPSFKPYALFKEDIPEGRLNDYLSASAACFPFMKIYNIDGTKFIDGAYYDNMPINMAIEKGAKEVVAVDLEGPGRYTQPRYDKYEGVTVRYVNSRWNLGDTLIFDSKTACRNIQLGYLDTMKVFGKYDGYKYTFYKGETDKFINYAYNSFLNFIGLNLNISADKPKSALERILRLNMARCLRKRWGKNLTKEETIIASAEAAAEVFDVDPLVIYNFNEFNRAIAESFAKACHEYEISADGNAKNAVPLIGEQRKRVIMFAKQLESGSNPGDNILAFSGYSTLFAYEVIAAIYVVTSHPISYF